MSKNTHKDRAVETIFLHIGITIGQQSSQSFNHKRHEVDMVTTPVGIYVHHRKTGHEHLVPYPNVHNIKYLKEEQECDSNSK